MNLAQQINAVTRRVARDGAQHTITVEQTFATTPEDLWDACTNPARLPRWFEPIAGDLVEGGGYTLTGSGTEGTIRQCERPRALRITWEYDGDISIVDVHLTPVGDSTRLSIHHTGPSDDHWTTYGPAAGGIGWDESLLALSLLLMGDERAHPEAMSTLMATDAGNDFVRGAGHSWQAAHLAAGADPDEARAQADRAVAAYHGEQ